MTHSQSSVTFLTHSQSSLTFRMYRVHDAPRRRYGSWFSIDFVIRLVQHVEYQFQGNQSDGSIQLKQQIQGITGSRMYMMMSYRTYMLYLLAELEIDTNRNKLQ